MMTLRQIQRLWSGKSYQRLSQELISARQEGAFELTGADRPCAVAALAIIRMDELCQVHTPLYGEMVRAVLSAQDRDGGWGDPAITALCLRALSLCEGDGVAVLRGLSYLAALQKDEGIWPAGPLRRMPEDPPASLFVLYELGDCPRFREAVRFSDALDWFTRNQGILSPECRTLCERTKLRCRFVMIRETPAPLFAA